jgi:uncharacterized protein
VAERSVAEKKLRVSADLALPLDVAGEVIGILAKRGAGKTNTGAVLVEELHGAGVQVVVLDPVGAWWGLRSSFDGKSPGLSIPIFGGGHGDVPLKETAGSLMADVVVDTRQSMVLDLTDDDEFPSEASMLRFATAFAERLYRRKAKQPSNMVIVLEEADEFAPKGGGVRRADGWAAKSVGAFSRIVRRGRSRGLGCVYITQRTASLHNDVLTQADVLILHRTTGRHDRDAIADWVVAHNVRDQADEVVPSLSGLKDGEAWVWNPERELLARVQVRRRRTFDSGATPKPGEVRAEPEKVAPIDLAQLGEQIAATAERAKENDPVELRKRIRELERMVQTPTQIRETERVVEVEKIVEVPVSVVSEGQVERLRNAARELKDVAASVGEYADEIVRELARVEAQEPVLAAAPAETAEREPTRREALGRPPVARAVPARPPSPPAPRSAAAAAGGLTGPQQRVLDAIAWYAALGVPAPGKTEVGFIAGYRVGKRVGGTYGNILGSLSTAGLVVYPSPGLVTLTGAGAAVARDPGIEPTNRGLQQAVFEKLDGPEKRVLQALVDVYPDALPKREVGERAGYTVGERVGGTFGNILGRLRSLGLIDYPSPGEAVATPLLFPEDA